MSLHVYEHCDTIVLCTDSNNNINKWCQHGICGVFANTSNKKFMYSTKRNGKNIRRGKKEFFLVSWHSGIDWCGDMIPHVYGTYLWTKHGTQIAFVYIETFFTKTSVASTAQVRPVLAITSIEKEFGKTKNLKILNFKLRGCENSQKISEVKVTFGKYV